jgi:hypothetical protein
MNEHHLLNRWSDDTIPRAATRDRGLNHWVSESVSQWLSESVAQGVNERPSPAEPMIRCPPRPPGPFPVGRAGAGFGPGMGPRPDGSIPRAATSDRRQAGRVATTAGGTRYPLRKQHARASQRWRDQTVRPLQSLCENSVFRPFPQCKSLNLRSRRHEI